MLSLDSLIHDADLPAACALRSLALGEDPIGSASKCDLILAVEAPLPWPKQAREARSLPTGTQDAVDALDASMSVLFVTLAPDPEYSVPGFAHVLVYRRPDSAFAEFLADDFLVPYDEVAVVVHSLAVDTDGAIDAFERYRQQATHRDLLVCTHGTRDNCCAVLGVPTYQHLRYLATTDEPEWRVWRCSHIGGHRFAPTLIDLPSGRFWARITPERAAFLRQQEPLPDLSLCYRGWSGLRTDLEQIAERATFEAEGWPWTRYHKSGRIRGRSDDGAQTEVEIHFSDPLSGRSGTYVVTLEWTGTFQSQSSCLGTKVSTVERYAVVGVDLERATGSNAHAAD
jgi:hypothetical protein